MIIYGTLFYGTLLNYIFAKPLQHRRCLCSCRYALRFERCSANAGDDAFIEGPLHGSDGILADCIEVREALYVRVLADAHGIALVPVSYTHL